MTAFVKALAELVTAGAAFIGALHLLLGEDGIWRILGTTDRGFAPPPSEAVCTTDPTTGETACVMGAFVVAGIDRAEPHVVAIAAAGALIVAALVFLGTRKMLER